MFGIGGLVAASLRSIQKIIKLEYFEIQEKEYESAGFDPAAKDRAKFLPQSHS